MIAFEYLDISIPILQLLFYSPCAPANEHHHL